MFERFDPPKKGANSKDPIVIVTKKGTVALNLAASRLLGGSEKKSVAVFLYVDKDDGRIGVKIDPDGDVMLRNSASPPLKSAVEETGYVHDGVRKTYPFVESVEEEIDYEFTVVSYIEGAPPRRPGRPRGARPAL